MSCDFCRWCIVNMERKREKEEEEGAENDKRKKIMLIKDMEELWQNPWEQHQMRQNRLTQHNHNTKNCHTWTPGAVFCCDSINVQRYIKFI